MDVERALRVFIWSECIARDGNPGLVSFSLVADANVCEGLDWLTASEDVVKVMAHKLADDCWNKRAVEYHGKSVSAEVVEFWPDKPAQSLRFIRF